VTDSLLRLLLRAKGPTKSNIHPRFLTEYVSSSFEHPALITWNLISRLGLASQWHWRWARLQFSLLGWRRRRRTFLACSSNSTRSLRYLLMSGSIRRIALHPVHDSILLIHTVCRTQPGSHLFTMSLAEIVCCRSCFSGVCE